MRLWIPIAVLLLATACTPDHPFDKPGTWHLDDANSANDANLRAMLVNPHDLVVGQGEPNAVGSEAATPVKNLLAGKRAPLPASGISPIEGGNQPSAQPVAAPGGSNGQ